MTLFPLYLQMVTVPSLVWPELWTLLIEAPLPEQFLSSGGILHVIAGYTSPIVPSASLKSTSFTVESKTMQYPHLIPYGELGDLLFSWSVWRNRRRYTVHAVPDGKTVSEYTPNYAHEMHLSVAWPISISELSSDTFISPFGKSNAEVLFRHPVHGRWYFVAHGRIYDENACMVAELGARTFSSYNTVAVSERTVAISTTSHLCPIHVLSFDDRGGIVDNPRRPLIYIRGARYSYTAIFAQYLYVGVAGGEKIVVFDLELSDCNTPLLEFAFPLGSMLGVSRFGITTTRPDPSGFVVVQTFI